MIKRIISFFPLLTFLMFFTSGLQAQQSDAPLKINGVVIGNEDRLPVISATVQNKEGKSNAPGSLAAQQRLDGRVPTQNSAIRPTDLLEQLIRILCLLK